MKKKVVTLLLAFILGLNLVHAQSSGTEWTAKAPAFQKALDKVVDGKKIRGASFCIKYGDQTWNGASGNMQPESQYFIASTTKLFVTALILNLQTQGKLKLDDKITQYLPAAVTNGLHVYQGVDYSTTLTIRHLLAHTSGLPDYFEDKNKEGISLENELFASKDQYWSFEKSIEISKNIVPKFAPGTKGKAHYSDTNFQLLGKIIETITGKSFAQNCEETIIRPLQLKHTYLYTDSLDRRPQALNYKANELYIPKAMTSFGADGGMVSTSGDMLIFTEAFFSGRFFPKSLLPELQQWNKIFPPLQSGVGIHRFKLGALFNPFGTIPELIGHSGLSGALAYYSPKKNLYITGTVNQIAYPQTSFKTAIKLMQIALK